MCIYWIKKYVKEIEGKTSANKMEKVREKRQIVGCYIAYDKSRGRIQKRVDNLPKARVLIF